MLGIDGIKIRGGASKNQSGLEFNDARGDGFTDRGSIKKEISRRNRGRTWGLTGDLVASREVTVPELEIGNSGGEGGGIGV